MTTTGGSGASVDGDISIADDSPGLNSNAVADGFTAAAVAVAAFSVASAALAGDFSTPLRAAVVVAEVRWVKIACRSSIAFKAASRTIATTFE